MEILIAGMDTLTPSSFFFLASRLHPDWNDGFGNTSRPPKTRKGEEKKNKKKKQKEDNHVMSNEQSGKRQRTSFSM